MFVAHETDPEVDPADTVAGEVAALIPEPATELGREAIELPTVSGAASAAGAAAHAVGAAVGGAMNDAVDEASAALSGAAIDAADLIESDGELDAAEAAEVALAEASEAEAPPEEGTTPSAEEGELAEDPTEAVGFAVPAVRPAARNPWAGRVPRQLVRLRTSQHRGGLNASELRSLTRYRNEHPQDVRARLVLGHEYIRRGWLTVGLDQYERALSLDLACRSESDLLPALIRVARTEGLTARASNMIVAAYGSEAAPAVDRAIARERDDEARGRLQLLRARL